MAAVELAGGGVIPPLTPEQAAALAEVLERSRHQALTTLGGLAGTGKTLLVAHLANRLGSSAAVVCPTWKAATVLRQRGIKGARSIHSLIYHAPDEYEVTDSRGRTTTQPDFSHSLRDEPVLNVSTVIVDEASMVSPQTLDDLCAIVPRVILVGDHGQLEPVERDDSGRTNPIFNPDVRLETIHRGASAIRSLAHHIRAGGSPFRWTTKDASVSTFQRATDDDLVGPISDGAQIIVAKHVLRKTINRRIRHALGHPQARPVPGDRVMSLNRRHGCVNGETWWVDWVDPTAGEIAIGNDWHSRTVPYFGLNRPPDIYSNDAVELDYAYAITCHKSQGSEWDHVIVIEPPRVPIWAYERWAYTAATRAKSTLWWYRAYRAWPPV